MAAGLLGAGSVFLGPAGDTAEFLAAAIVEHRAERGVDDDDVARDRGVAVVASRVDAGQRVPGLGHPVHRVEDPRTPRLYAIAAEEGLVGPHLRLLAHVAVGVRGQRRGSTCR